MMTDCCATKLVLSVEEEEILRKMRGLRKESQAIKAELQGLVTGVDERADELRCRLEELRQEFNLCRERLKSANQLKMKRLGHLS